MMQVPAQYAIYPVIDAVLNGTSAVLLLVGRATSNADAWPRTAPS